MKEMCNSGASLFEILKGKQQRSDFTLSAIKSSEFIVLSFIVTKALISLQSEDSHAQKLCTTWTEATHEDKQTGWMQVFLWLFWLSDIIRALQQNLFSFKVGHSTQAAVAGTFSQL